MTDDTAIADPAVDEPEPAVMVGRHAPAVAGRCPGDTFHQMNAYSVARRRRIRAT